MRPTGLTKPEGGSLTDHVPFPGLPHGYESQRQWLRLLSQAGFETPSLFQPRVHSASGYLGARPWEKWVLPLPHTFGAALAASLLSRDASPTIHTTEPHTDGSSAVAAFSGG